ncbi:Fumagillin beta-trans-bergamotene synthase [Colletotrichum viniferum]|nr:Fumagillin beta-trans-bergamotene synthase [Colletotrichum viniferum]
MGKINIEICPTLTMEEESMGFHLDEKETLSRSRRSPLYHLKTLYLFTKSDCKTVVLPQMLFAISSILTNGFRDLDTLPTLTLTTFKPLIHAVIWIYSNLLLENLANQRLPGSMIEDAANKPWRPLPSGRITADQTRRIALYLVPSLMIFGAYSGAFRETTSFIAFVWMYNDLDAADTSIWWRNIANALGLMAFSAGALAITGGTVEYGLKNAAVVWILTTGAVVLTTVHAQDLPDVVGDRAKGRKTVPLVYGDGVARWTLAVGVFSWSVFLPMFWELGWGGYALVVGLGLSMVCGTLWRRTVDDDEVVWKIWCAWAGLMYLLPSFKVFGF